MVDAGTVRPGAAPHGGGSMRRIIVIALSGITLSGCTPFSVPGFGFLTPSPPAATLQLESMPPGAEARTSAGPSCRTPCSVSVATEPLTVTFTLDWHEPQSVAVQPIQQTIVNPNVDAVGSTVVMELDPKSGVCRACAHGASETDGEATAAEARRRQAAARGCAASPRILAVSTAFSAEPRAVALAMPPK
jgi:hypothetical protein